MAPLVYRSIDRSIDRTTKKGGWCVCRVFECRFNVDTLCRQSNVCTCAKYFPQATSTTRVPIHFTAASAEQHRDLARYWCVAKSCGRRSEKVRLASLERRVSS
eukprot:scaffold4875_cov155-Amphora_coffeaeformis.AAC.5